MNKEIAGLLKANLVADGGLPFIDIIAGLAQRVEYKTQNADGNPITLRMPVSYDVTEADGIKSTPEKAVVPDSTKKGIIYFEDMGIRFVGSASGGAFKYQSDLVLVCWMNRARITGDNYTEISSHCITTILKKLGVNKVSNYGNFSRVKIIPSKILPQDAAVFSRYTYDETVTQYLRPPFEFFGMMITVEFCINENCIDKLTINNPSCY